MLVYHRTSDADAILREGFRDAEGYYMTPKLWRGVWVSADAPLTENEGAYGTTTLVIDIPESVFAKYEWDETGKPYREALIPADELNRYPVRALSEEEELALEGEWFEGE
jgi:hypothetical protein